MGSTRLIIAPLIATVVEECSIFAQQELLSFEHYPEDIRIQEIGYYEQDCLQSYCQSPAHILLVARWEGEICGLIHCSLQTGVAWVCWILIPPKFRRKNIAFYLWRAMFKELKLRQIHALWGSIRSTNIEAIRMAQAIGFTEIGSAPNFWHGLDYLLVQRSLRPSN